MSNNSHMNNELELIIPDWPAPASVKAAVTTRKGGGSEAPYDSFNLANHVGDDELAVVLNRELLKGSLGLSAEPAWLKQTHSDIVVDASIYSIESGSDADASFSTEKGKACVVLTADCLPILLCNKQGTWVMAVHAGWQGLAKRMVEAAVAAYPGDKGDVMAWLGPAIGPHAFEVQNDVVEACTADLTPAQKKIFTKKCFKPVEGKEGYFLGDLYELGKQRLHKCGVQAVYGGGFCTYTDAERFYSYRRDGVGGEKATGRMASLIWLV